jgi:hypothetical protein
MESAVRRLATSVLLLGFLWQTAGETQAQLLRGRRLQALRAGPEVEAVAGSPFGVGRLSVRLPDARPGFFGEREFSLKEAEGRVLYAAFQSQPVRAILREVLNRPQDVTVTFLFTGDEPLELELLAAEPVRMRVSPRRDPAAHQALLAAWWNDYTSAARRSAESDEYPQLVDSYLVAMLSQRLGLEPPSIDRSLFPRPELEQSIGVLLGTESTRLKVQEQLMLSPARPAAATEQVPSPVALPEVVAPEVKDVKIEDIAMHVPAECFYVRFGNFNNYLWFSRLLREFGGELRNLVALRGVDYQLNARQEQQLSLKESSLAEVLGPQVIADVALIGQDMFLREGAAIGILFQARNNFALSTDIRSQRSATLKANRDAVESKIEIGGHEVSFLSTPDNRVRSFYAADGDFHFVTTSRAMVERFYEAGAGKNALGQAAEFRLARSEVALEREDSVFAYLSSAFFENLLGPHYRIEMTRRMRATVGVDLVKMAMLAAKNEGRRELSIDELVRDRFLPPGISLHPDGSHLVIGKDGDVVDSLRGAAGSFTPVPDIAFDAVTPDEARDYRQFADTIFSRWQRFDPMIIAAKRFAGATPQLERVAIDARVTPIAVGNHSRLTQFIGPPVLDRMAPLAANVAGVEAVTRGPGPQPIHLYAGVLDTGAPADFADDLLGGLRALLNIKFYFGGWPSAGMFSFFGLRDDLPVDPNGFGRVSALLWQRSDGPFITGSTDPDVLAQVTPQFQIVEAERPAQLWLQLRDLNRSELAALVNGYGYFRARQITGGDLRFLHRLIAQLGVTPKNAKSVAENLIGGRLVSALGGEYQLTGGPGGTSQWNSSAWDRNASRLITAVPRGFTTPPLDWLRSIHLDAALTERELSLHGVVDMQRRAPPTATAPNATPSEAGKNTGLDAVLPAFPSNVLEWFGGKKDDPRGGKSKTESPNSVPADGGNSGKSKPTDRSQKAEELPPPDSRAKDAQK